MSNLVQWCGPFWGVAPDGSLPPVFFLSVFFEFVEEVLEENEDQLRVIRSDWNDAYKGAFDAAVRAVQKKSPDASDFDVLLPPDGWPLFMSQMGRKTERSPRGNMDAQRVKTFLLLTLVQERLNREQERFRFWQLVAEKGAPAAEIQARHHHFERLFADFLKNNEHEAGLFSESGFTIDDLLAALVDSPQNGPWSQRAKETPQHEREI